MSHHEQKPQPGNSRPAAAGPEQTAIEPGDHWLAYRELTTAEQRHATRVTAIGIRPIRLRPMDQPGLPVSPWHVADIINISHGGLCLMAKGLDHAVRGQQLELDLRSHPDFGSLTLLSSVRWIHPFGQFITLGIAFLTPLEHIPRLELERRFVRRDEEDGRA